MNKEIKTNLIDTPNKVEVDYWTGEWINEDDIIKNLVDESVVLTIANKTVRDRMLSISESAKSVEKTNQELRNRIYKLENENRELQAKVNEIDKLTRQKAEEILKDVEREKYGYVSIKIPNTAKNESLCSTDFTLINKHISDTTACE